MGHSKFKCPEPASGESDGGDDGAANAGGYGGGDSGQPDDGGFGNSNEVTVSGGGGDWETPDTGRTNW